MEIKRHIFSKLCDDLDDRRATLVVGARQVGKTYLLKKIQAEAIKRRRSTAYFDLEQPADSLKFAQPDAAVVELLVGSAEVVFIDEFHYLENASHLIKAIYDSGAHVKLYASGSSAMEIHRHLKESLAGRKLIRRVHPCSAGEISESSSEFQLNNYLKFGGMPGVYQLLDAGEKQILLADILQSYILKDIKGLIREENVRAFNALVYLLADRQGSLISGSNLAREVGMTPRTIEAYLEILAQTYVASPVHSYSHNLGNELKKSRKFYIYDQGMRNAVLKDFRSVALRADAGAIIEGFVFNELAVHLGPATELRFWRTKAGEEVDFIWVANRVPYPVEVKHGDTGGVIPRGLRAFLRRYPATRQAFVVHGGEKLTVQENNVSFHFCPIVDAATILAEINHN